MAFIDLFIKPDENSENKPTTEAKTGSEKFPTTAPTKNEAPASAFTFPQETNAPTFTPNTYVAPSNNVSSEHLQKALELYQAGFDSLNQAGFDFYEFYQSVSHGGMDNPQVYAMAFQMAYGMDKTITKEKLIQQAEFYLGEIQKSYDEFVSKGTAKKTEVEQLKNSENQSLTNEVNSLEQQLEALKVQIQDRKNKLQLIDGKYNPQLNEIDSKLAANTTAKDTIINSIQKVKQGINTNIK